MRSTERAQTSAQDTPNFFPHFQFRLCCHLSGAFDARVHVVSQVCQAVQQSNPHKKHSAANVVILSLVQNHPYRHKRDSRRYSYRAVVTPSTSPNHILRISECRKSSGRIMKTVCRGVHTQNEKTSSTSSTHLHTSLQSSNFYKNDQLQATYKLRPRTVTQTPLMTTVSTTVPVGLQ